MEIEFWIMAIVAFVLIRIDANNIIKSLEMIGVIGLFLPIIVVMLSAISQVYPYDPATADAVANEVANSTFQHIVVELPGIIKSEVTGAIVGVFGGTLVNIYRQVSA